MTLFHDHDSLNCSCRITAKSRRAIYLAISVIVIKYKIIIGYIIFCLLNIFKALLYSYWVKVLINKFLQAYNLIYFLMKVFYVFYIHDLHTPDYQFTTSQ